MEDARKIRRIVADTIRSKQQLYNHVYLNQDPGSYSQWITDDNAWGGAIEIALLADHFKVQVCCWDVQSTRFDLYEVPGSTQRVYFIYDGIHYDPLAMGSAAGDDESADLTMFDCDNASRAFLSSEAMCRQMNAQQQFTDTSKFALRCLVCGAGLTGEDDAMKHAQNTTPHHTNFSEYQK
jgi:ubiquitin thioesterase OTU1